MPRKYIPKNKTYTDSNLKEALEKVQNGDMTYREAGCTYNIDKSLLWRKIHNYNTSKQGRKTVLNVIEEEDLANKIKIMAKWGWALSRNEIREIVHTYIVQNNINNNFKNSYPGKDWLKMFLKRNELVGRKMEQLEKSRRQATSDPFIIYHFYGILEETLSAMDLHDKPHQIFNLDETSFSSDPTRLKGVTGKGQKAHRIIQGSGKDNTTVLGCVSAGGRLLPPLIVFKGQNLWSSWKGTYDIPGTTYACSENGWMITRIFNQWLENFCKTVTERPLLVIFDGHATHLDPATIDLAVRENVALLKLPPHTSDILQPLDRSCFGPIKYKWNQKLIEWQRLNQRSMTKSEFTDLLSAIWRDGVSEEVIKNSFKVTGLYPVNKEVYPKERLDPIKLDRYNKFESSGSDAKPFNVSEVYQDDILACVSPSLLETENPTGVPAEDVQPLLNPTTTASSSTHNNTEPSCSFESLLLNKINCTKSITGKRRKIDGKGKLLTSEQYLKSIENLQKHEKKRKITGQKTKKQKCIPKKTDSETDFEDEEVPYEDESDLENVSLSALINAEQDEELDELNIEFDLLERSETENQLHNNAETENNLNLASKSCNNTSFNEMDELEYGIGDFILVGHTSKNGKRYYIARIEGSDDEETLSVIYLKRTKKFFFAYPDTHIIYSIHKDEIVKKLPFPIQKNKRSALMFEIDLEKYKIK